MKSYSYILFLVIIFIAACEKKSVIEDFDEAKFGYDYFPLEVGKWWVYNVDSVIYDDLGATVTETNSQVKEELVEKFTDATGDEIYRMERSWRATDTLPWEITDVWVTWTDDSRAFRTEENLKFVKFVFPALEGKRWDGNVFFDPGVEITVAGETLAMFKDWDDYELETVDEAEVVGEQSYGQVATVLLTDDEEVNTVERRYALEKYARGVGLIYKENIILDVQGRDTSVPWEEDADKGFILKQTLLEHN